MFKYKFYLPLLCEVTCANCHFALVFILPMFNSDKIEQLFIIVVLFLQFYVRLGTKNGSSYLKLSTSIHYFACTYIVSDIAWTNHRRFARPFWSLFITSLSLRFISFIFTRCEAIEAVVFCLDCRITIKDIISDNISVIIIVMPNSTEICHIKRNYSNEWDFEKIFSIIRIKRKWSVFIAQSLIHCDWRTKSKLLDIIRHKYIVK